MNSIRISALTLALVIANTECRLPDDWPGPHAILEYKDPLLGAVYPDEPLYRAHGKVPMEDYKLSFKLFAKICTGSGKECWYKLGPSYRSLYRSLSSPRGEPYTPCPRLTVTIHAGNKSTADEFTTVLNKFYHRNVGTYCTMLVDWSEHAHQPANVITVGRQLAAILYLMVNCSLVDPANIYLIGHSLGPHVAHHASGWFKFLMTVYDPGMVTRFNKLQIGRITGLDPIADNFAEHEGTYLVAKDAAFVDVIHTTNARRATLIAVDKRPPPAYGKGFWFNIGTVDFYPNGGTVPQPGCMFLKTDYNGKWKPRAQERWEKSITCSHEIAIMFFIQSMQYDNGNPRGLHEKVFPSLSCDSMENLPNCVAERPNDWSSMGIQAVDFPGTGSQYLSACGNTC